MFRVFRSHSDMSALFHRPHFRCTTKKYYDHQLYIFMLPTNGLQHRASEAQPYKQHIEHTHHSCLHHDLAVSSRRCCAKPRSDRARKNVFECIERPLDEGLRPRPVQILGRYRIATANRMGKQCLCLIGLNVHAMSGEAN